MNRYVLVIPTILAFASQQPCFANAGVPMMALMAVPMWGLLLVIIPLEAFLAEKILALPRLRAQKLSFSANAASTIAGVPLTWVLLVGLELLVTESKLINVNWDGSGKFLFLLMTAPWLYPFRSDMYWMAPAAALLLLIPFFFASFWVEYFTGKWMLREEDSAKVKQWAWKANCISYAIMFSITAIWLMTNIVNHQSTANNDEHKNVDQVSADRLWELAIKKQSSERTYRDVPGHKERYKGKLQRPMDRFYWDANYELENGHADKAEKILRDGLAIIDTVQYQKKTNIEERAGDGVNITNQLADLYFKQGRYADAIPVYERLVRLEDEHLPAQAGDTFVTSSYPQKLAIAYEKENKPQDAEKFYKHVLAQNAKYAPKDDNRSITLAYADFCNRQGRSKDAEKLYLSAAAKRESHNYPDDQNPQQILARFYVEQKQYERAEQLLLAEIKYRQEHDMFGEFPDDSLIAPLALQLGQVYLAQGQLDRAEHYIKLSLRGRKLNDAAMAYSRLLQQKGEGKQAAAWQKRAANVKGMDAANEDH